MAQGLHIFSFFSGAGFLDLGFEMNDFTIDAVNEYSNSFQRAYQFSRAHIGLPAPRFGYSTDVNDFLTPAGNRRLRDNIRTIRQEDYLVGFIGGPPCPDFSIAGKQRGKDGDNGKLSQSYVNIILRQKPDFFLFENVKGLWSTAKHRLYYEELKTSLSKSYFLTDRLCNALEFGTPQDRERILLFGVKKGIARQNRLPLSSFNWSAHIEYNVEEIKRLPWPMTNVFAANNHIPCPPNLPQELTAEHWFVTNNVNNHPNSKDYFQPRAGLARMQSVLEGDDSRKSYKRIHRWRYSPTVCYGNNEVHLHPYLPRRLSAAEALALQSLPANFILPNDMSLSDKFKTIGNGVPFLLAQGIARTIHDYFEPILE